MTKPRKGTSESGTKRSPARAKRRTESSRRNKRNTTPSDSSEQPNSKIQDLPPNENIRKRADEVYGDTEIPERKSGS
jgi:hypothetical protein